MKSKRTSKFLCAALLVASLAFALTARAQNGRETSLALPKARGANLFLTVGPTYMNAKASDVDGSGADLYGAMLAFGWRLDKYNKIQIEIGGLAGSESGGRGYSHYSLDYIVVPELFTYNFCIPLTQSGRCELRLSPSIGAALVYTDFSDSHWVYNRDADIALAVGMGAGLTIHVTPKFFLDIGYRFLRVSKTEYDWGYIDSLNTHSLAFSLGWKF